MNIITLCGSLRFQECMMRTAEKMALLGNCVLTPIYPTSENPERTKEQLEMLKEEHFKKIELSDAILVINVDEYIGYSTNLEIEYAKKLNKEILYYTDLIKNKIYYRVYREDDPNGFYIVDDSEEDYLYPDDFFEKVD